MNKTATGKGELFRCYACREVFAREWTNEEAEEEYLANGFPADADQVTICDDCYRALMRWRARHFKRAMFALALVALIALAVLLWPSHAQGQLPVIIPRPAIGSACTLPEALQIYWGAGPTASVEDDEACDGVKWTKGVVTTINDPVWGKVKAVCFMHDKPNTWENCLLDEPALQLYVDPATGLTSVTYKPAGVAAAVTMAQARGRGAVPRTVPQAARDGITAAQAATVKAAAAKQIKAANKAAVKKKAVLR